MYKKSDKEWEEYIGEQLKALRIRKNMSQEELASRIGVSKPTINRIENGKGSSLATFIKVVQIVGQEGWLESLAPRSSVSPVQIKNSGKKRERVGRNRKK